VEIYSGAPLFFVADIGSAVAYYAGALGFSTDRVWGDPPGFAMPTRDGVRVMLSQVADRSLIVPRGTSDGRYDAYFWVRDASTLFVEMTQNGADIAFAPIDRTLYAMREFAVRDRDGYRLVFASDNSAT
jgi:uncharacterized glyoxalase superfamily protein PhnB